MLSNMGEAVTISSPLLAAILADARADPARERCGLLLGPPGVVEAVHPCANVAADPARRFELDPAALFAALRAERAGGAMLLGHYHSHPGGGATPSMVDAAAAAGDGGRLWLIVGMDTVLAWRSVAGGPLHGAFAPVALVTPADPLATRGGAA